MLIKKRKPVHVVVKLKWTGKTDLKKDGGFNMTTTEKLMLFGILAGLSLTLYSIHRATQIMSACQNIEDRSEKLLQAEYINLL